LRFLIGEKHVTLDELRQLVRSIPDFPKPGILFRDITTLIGHGAGFSAAIDHLAAFTKEAGGQAIAGARRCRPTAANRCSCGRIAEI